MKTTLDFPDGLVKEIKLRAVHEGKRLKDAMAELLRRGLDAPSDGKPTAVRADDAMLKARAKLTNKFVSGEWRVAVVASRPAQSTS